MHIQKNIAQNLRQRNYYSNFTSARVSGVYYGATQLKGSYVYLCDGAHLRVINIQL